MSPLLHGRFRGHRPVGRRAASSSAFALVELLVVIGIIGLLMAILLPALAAARAESRAVLCLSNVRQVATALYTYGGGKRLPPNISTPSPGRWGSDDDRVGQFFPRVAGKPSVLACPSDEGGSRSYAMNVWASSQIDSYMKTASPKRGALWQLAEKRAESLILVIEAWSTTSVAGGEWAAEPTVGYAGLKPGQRFGAAGGVGGLVNTKRWGLASCELPYYRHRTRAVGSAPMLAPVGRVAIAYADGHAGFRSESILADMTSGLSSLDSLWSPMDDALNQ